MRCSSAFKQARTVRRALDLAYGILNCLGRRTVTGMLSASGQQFKDWSAAYRLFHGQRMDVSQLFSVIRKEFIERHLPAHQPVYAHMDDTIIGKHGKKIVGASWLRDPLGPPFHTNFIWGQRFIQLSVSLPESVDASRSRAIPVDFHHCPVAKKPKKDAAPEAWADYKVQKKNRKLSQVGSDRLHLLREQLDHEGASSRRLITSVDGSYTNETVIRHLPSRTTIIGRVRKDCRLHALPHTTGKQAGRKRIYGEQLPTPEQIRQSDVYTWQEIKAWAAGKIHTFNVKVINNVRWRKAGEQNLQLVVIRPLAYRLTKRSKMLYRQPCYLICTDPKLEIHQLLQAYLWRWEIEVNFHDEKTLFGCGEAQVRKGEAVWKVPAFGVAVYAMLLLAERHVATGKHTDCLPRPKWYPKKPQQRATTGDVINTARSQLWARYQNFNFSDFVNSLHRCKSINNNLNPTLAAMFYARF